MADKVDTTHPDHDKYKGIWTKCRDVVAGEEAVKEKGKNYLPIPTGQDNAQYKRYKQRAQFFNATQRIVDAIVGQIFRRLPVLTPPEINDGYVTQDGKTIIQYSKDVLKEVVTVGRIGSLIDHGESIESSAYIVMYQAEKIINWDYEIIDGQKITKLVVLEEHIKKSDDVFSHDYKIRYRVLSLKNGVYVQNIWTKKDNAFVEGADIIPLIDGKPIQFIPFYVLSSSGITLDVEKPIIKDVVDINIGHYVNSADFENDLHWSGIKTPCFPGWPESKSEIPVGKPLAVPVASQPFMLESTSTSAIKEEMTRKEERMAVIGSQIIAQQGRYVQAAETANVQRIGETSVLSSLSENMDNYFNKILEILVLWSNKNEEVTISFNKDFDPGEANMDQLVKMAGLVGGKFLSYNTFFNYAKKNEIIPRGKTVEEELDEIAEDIQGEEAELDGQLPE